MTSKTFKVEGMTCSSCQAAVERIVSEQKGVSKASVNLIAKTLDVTYQEAELTEEKIIRLVEKAGYSIQSIENNKLDTDTFTNSTEINQIFKRLIISIIFTLPLFLIAMGPMVLEMFSVDMMWMENAQYMKVFAVVQLLLTIPIMIVNRNYYKVGIRALINRYPNMDSLISIGTLTTFLYGIYTVIEIVNGNLHHDLYFESVGVILTLITLGKYLEAKSKGKTSEAIKKLIDLTPKKAIVIRNGKEVEIAVEKIVISDIIVVKPGQKFSVDGVIEKGETTVDESMLTGESLPIDKIVNDKVIGGTINQTGNIVYRATKTIENSTLSQIIELVENAQKEKAPISKLADVVSRYFVPIVIVIAFVSSIGWFVVGESVQFSLTIFVSVLIIACPCALGLATPTAIMVATGKGAEQGILIKNGEALEIAHKVNTVVFDKTGTLTKGKMVVTDIFVYHNYDKNKVLSLAASLEKKSEHPLGEAIVQKCFEQSLDLLEVDSFQSLSGFGITGQIGKDKLLIGNQKLMKNHKIDTTEYKEVMNQLSLEGKTPIIVSINQQIASIIAIRDDIKNDSIDVIKQLKKMNINCVMLTGDNQYTANAIASEIGIETVISEVLPHEKHEKIKQLKEQKNIVAMVGDGINDAIALAESDVGIAIGSGTDIAIESSNIVLMRDDLQNVVNVIRLSKKTIRIVKENLFWAFIYNVVGIFIAAGFLYIFKGPLLNPMFAGFAMAMSSVSVLNNTLRLNRVKLNK